MNSNDGFINEDIIIAKAKSFGEKLNVCNFLYTNGWLSNFKKRFNLKLPVLHGEAASINDSLDDICNF